MPVILPATTDNALERRRRSRPGGSDRLPAVRRHCGGDLHNWLFDQLI
ncbi:hypothetical protein [Streptomyces sp. NPDC002491]